MLPDHAFTQHDTPALRRRIQGDLSRIAKRVREADPSLRALALTGGFSRGEGSARGDVPLNDYDVIAIRDAAGAGPYKQLHTELSEQIGLEVDLLPIWRARLPYVGRKLFWLDARLGARVFYGDPDALAPLRRFEEVDPGEIARLLGNRAAGLLLALPGAGEAPDAAQRDLQSTKAVLAALDATLLHSGRYAPTLEERLALAQGHADHALFRTAVAWKLHGANDAPGWSEARDALLRAVEATGAGARRDGLTEHALHLVRARRFARDPSQSIRARAWSWLRDAAWPEAPDAWRKEKPRFFAERALTLQ